MKTLLFTLLLIPLLAFAKDQPLLLKKHTIMVSGGMKFNSHTSAAVSNGSVQSDLGITGFVGYEYRFNPYWSVNTHIGMFGVESDVGVSGVSNITISYILIGFRYDPEFLALADNLQLYGGLNMGSFIGTASQTGMSGFSPTVSTVTETQFGGQVLFGMDVYVSDWLKIGPMFSYSFIPDFNKVVGELTNYSGGALSVTLGLLL